VQKAKNPAAKLSGAHREKPENAYDPRQLLCLRHAPVERAYPTLAQVVNVISQMPQETAIRMI
jgi:hypothetical protein